MPAKAAVGTAALAKARLARLREGGAPAPSLPTLARPNEPGARTFHARSGHACDSLHRIISRRRLARCWTNDQLVVSGCLPILDFGQPSSMAPAAADRRKPVTAIGACLSRSAWIER